MHPQKSTIAMGPHRVHHQAVVLHAVLLLLCLALLTLVSAEARHAPFESVAGRNSDVVSESGEEVTREQPEAAFFEGSSSFTSETEREDTFPSDTHEDDLKKCVTLPGETTEECMYFDHRMLVDYPPPTPNHNSHPGGD